MILNKLCLMVVIGVSCLLSVGVQADDCDGNSASNFGLCQEFQLIRNLAPHASVISLIQKHMDDDIRFRKAVQYMLSSEFKETTAKIDATVTYQSFLRPFIRAGVNITDIKSVGKIFDCVLIPLIEEATSSSRSNFYTENTAESRSLDTFIQEVVNLIPTDKLVNTLKTQIAKNKQFADFYEVIRNPSFRSKVTKGLSNRDISRPIKTLRRFQIDLCKLVEYAFNLFYLGPAV